MSATNTKFWESGWRRAAMKFMRLGCRDIVGKAIQRLADYDKGLARHIVPYSERNNL